MKLMRSLFLDGRFPYSCHIGDEFMLQWLVPHRDWTFSSSACSFKYIPTCS